MRVAENENSRAEESVSAAPLMMEQLFEQLAERVANKVVEKLTADKRAGYVDQRESPLGSRKHIAAIRSGQLRGFEIRRRYFARREDVEAFVSKRTAEPRPAVAGSAS